MQAEYVSSNIFLNNIYLIIIKLLINNSCMFSTTISMIACSSVCFTQNHILSPLNQISRVKFCDVDSLVNSSSIAAVLMKDLFAKSIQWQFVVYLVIYFSVVRVNVKAVRFEHSICNGIKEDQYTWKKKSSEYFSQFKCNFI